MSLKSIEMQVALPRTFDAGKISEQLQQKGQVTSDQASNEMDKKLQRERHSTVKMEQKEKALLKDDFSKDQGGEHQNEKQKSENQELVLQTSHPYKGKTIDYNG